MSNTSSSTFNPRQDADSSLVHLPREPQEVHPRHQDGFRRPEEGQGQERPHHLPQGGHPISGGYHGVVCVCTKTLHLSIRRLLLPLYNRRRRLLSGVAGSIPFLKNILSALLIHKLSHFSMITVELGSTDIGADGLCT